MGDVPLAADASCLLGAVARAAQRSFEAERYLSEALRRSAEGRAPMAEAETWEELGRLRADEGRNEEAAEALRQARRCWLALGSRIEALRMESQSRALVAEA
jgi:tetratricopeptide (TPR) repeat protein